MFPFSIRYSSDTAISAATCEPEKVFRDIRSFLEQKSTRKIEINNNSLSFKSASRSSWNLMSPIDRGLFEVKEIDGYLTVSYEFFMYQLFIFSSAAAVIMGLVSKNGYWGFFIFCWIGGMNWIIALIRQRALLDNVISYISSDDRADSSTT